MFHSNLKPPIIVHIVSVSNYTKIYIYTNILKTASRTQKQTTSNTRYYRGIRSTLLTHDKTNDQTKSQKKKKHWQKRYSETELDISQKKIKYVIYCFCARVSASLCTGLLHRIEFCSELLEKFIDDRYNITPPLFLLFFSACFAVTRWTFIYVI